MTFEYASAFCFFNILTYVYLTHTEIENLTEILDCYKIELEKLREEGD